ncbi:MAG: molybdenum cofactor biosynthesis protein MoaE [Tepidisphaeraceae bacterium]|jgi:molybdopterin synthase catalytic subunit
MVVEVGISEGPLAAGRPLACEGAGAILLFEGIVRPSEDGRLIAGLHYEAYEPMAQSVLTQLSQEIVRRHDLLALRVEHSRGHVPGGRCSFRLQIASRHRKEGIAAMDEFIDRLKQDVPIWKTPVSATGRQSGGGA